VPELPDETIRTGLAVLRPPRPSDAEEVAQACADPAIQRYIPLVPDPYTSADALRWIIESRAAARAAGGTTLVAADPETDRPLAGFALHPARPGGSTAELGYWVAPWARRRGIATAGTAALAGWAHRQGVYRVELLTDPENWRSQRVAIAAGFRREGLRRGAERRRDGSHAAVVAWARLADDPTGPTPRALPDLPDGSLTDGVVTLRPLGRRDADDLYALHSLAESVATSVPPVPPQRSEISRRCAEAAGLWLAGERAGLTIRDAATGRFAGDISLFYGDRHLLQGMLGYGLLPAWRGRGFATRAVRLLAGWALTRAGLARVIAGTAPANVASQRVLERAGFTREAYQRALLPGPEGTRIDNIQYALLPTDPR
jgi:RimJ/RimL family protein N-acetyltransferase